jgi:hypothetical protein
MHTGHWSLAFCIKGNAPCIRALTQRHTILKIFVRWSALEIQIFGKKIILSKVIILKIANSRYSGFNVEKIC